MPGDLLRPALRSFGERLAELPALMADAGVDASIIAHRSQYARAVAAALCAL